MTRSPVKPRCDIRVGSKLRVWWSQRKPDNMATVLAVLPYSGLYTQFFDCVLRLTAPNTRSGSLEMAYNSSEWKYEKYRR